MKRQSSGQQLTLSNLCATAVPVCLKLFSAEKSQGLHKVCVANLAEKTPLISYINKVPRIKVSLFQMSCDPQKKGFYCTCVFSSREIFQWHFDYLPVRREKEQFEDRSTFPFLSTTTFSAFSIYRISSIHFTPNFPHICDTLPLRH